MCKVPYQVASVQCGVVARRAGADWQFSVSFARCKSVVTVQYSRPQYSATVLLPAAHYFSNFPDSENCTNNEMKVGQQQQRARARPSNVSCKPNHFRSSVSMLGAGSGPGWWVVAETSHFISGNMYVVANVDSIGIGSYPLVILCNDNAFQAIWGHIFFIC